MGPRVMAIELFFDLVFVFMVTQVTGLVVQAHGVQGLLMPLVVLTIIWWHYAGYVWLTNDAGAGGWMRFVLIAAMAGFLVMAVSLPDLFGSGGLAFGLAYAFIVVVHLGAFLARAGRAGIRPVLRLAPINLGVAALVLAAGALRTPWAPWLYVAALGLFVLSSLLGNEEGFSVRAGHFAERHGLVILIALGESVVAVGASAVGNPLDPSLLLALLGGVALLAAAWWAYFGGDDAAAERALGEAPPAQRSRMALAGYWATHLVMVAGIILLAAGLHDIVAHPLATGGTHALLAAAGVAVYLLGTALFRVALHVGMPWFRLAAAAATSLVGWLAQAMPGLALLASAAALVGGSLVAERIAHRTAAKR